MIQLAALPAPTAPTAPPGLLAQQSANGPADAGFSQVLALLQGGGGAPGAAPGEGADSPEQAFAAVQILAAPNVAGGKILPLGELALPGRAAAQIIDAKGAAPELAEQAAGPTADLRLKPAVSALPALLAAVRTIRVPVVLAPVHDDTASDEKPAPAPQAADTPPLTAQMAAIAAAPAPETARGEAAAFAGNAPVSAPILPALIDAQLRGLPLAEGKAQAASVPAEPRGGADAIRMLPVSALRPDAAPAAFSLGEAAAPAASHAVRLRTGLGDAAKAPVSVTGADLPGSALGALIAPAPADTSASAIGAAALPGAVAGPQDFGTLVDRLIEARDAAAPVGVDVAVNHAEFGKVSLHFRHEEGGLSVSVASADPDFARAVQAAVPPPAAGSGADSMGQNAQGSSPQAFVRQDGPGGQAAGQNNGQSSGQSGGQSGQPAVNRRAERAATDTTASDTTANDRANGRGRFA